MVINKITSQTSTGIYKISPDEGPAFFVRQEYLPTINLDLEIFSGAEFTEDKVDELLDAGLACAVEFKAMLYLARAEQCRFNLSQKLLKKDFQKKYVNMCLDYLESVNYLSDERYASAWLHGRRLNHAEGRSKLMAELQSRGISKEVAQKSVEEFFQNNDEDQIALKAYKKFIKRGKTEDKLIAAMMQSGFTYKQIKEVKVLYEEENQI